MVYGLVAAVHVYRILLLSVLTKWRTKKGIYTVNGLIKEFKNLTTSMFSYH